ncbi:head-tail adaptor protein [Shimia marina]|uniref:Bacteriophage head-tail adaptor n=1 Tax=Shimia marina TaxID=321267 RepID=A0A0P1ESE6_9RHOB|nr:head-tail adaptor protein [Shimia marina]CUH53457.1 Bacteriophage head-tail adaptor [Shimia marina]SFD76467.1 head-tail adaptor [Shimia marina]
MSAPVTLSRHLLLERPVAAPDGAGGFSRNWEALGVVWAEMRARGGGERDGGAVTLSAARYRVTLRGAPVGSSLRPTPECRFREGTRVFAIETVTEADDLGRYLTCHVLEEVAT